MPRGVPSGAQFKGALLIVSASSTLLQPSPVDAQGMADTQNSPTAPFGDSTGIATVRGMDFMNSAMETTAAKAAALSSKPNAPFLRRGTRATLERMHIERLTGRRNPTDWLIAGSGPWLQRRDAIERQNKELVELLAISTACQANPNIPVWSDVYSCELFCGRAWPCASCQDNQHNGDEVDIDCGGSCIPCPTCFDYVQNGFEEGVDCGGACEACVVAGDLNWWENATVSGELVPEPEPEDTGANTAIYSGSSCDGMSMIECVQDGANFQSWYAKENNPFYPWEPGSMAYSNFNWMEYDSWHNGSHPEHPNLPFMENAHVLYG